jgi:hypothetical protein
MLANVGPQAVGGGYSRKVRSQDEIRNQQGVR